MEENKNLHIDQLNHGNYPEPDIPVDEAWANMKNLLHHVPVHGSSVKGVSLGKSLKFLVSKSFVVAVSGAIIASASIWYLTTKKVRPTSREITYRSQSIPLKETLSDSLIVYLDSYSNIQEITDANNGNHISLTGAMYVETTDQHNIKINAGELEVVPVQAKIYVSFDAASETSLVQVQSGKAFLRTGDTTAVTLTAGMSAKYDRRTGQLEQQQKLNVNAFGYATHSFEFSNTLLGEAAKDIQKAYGISIKFSNPTLYNCRLTTRFDNQPLEEVLDIMAYTLNIQYSFDQKKNEVIFKGDGCK
jgi:ferric-dicitrate binding protein FerR (iron transport regulator)